MRAKMDRRNRAKQFMPFASLPELAPALRQQEFVPLEQILLAEDAQCELDLTLQSMSLGAEVCVVYYAEGRYESCTGVFHGQDEADGRFRIGKLKIEPERLLSVELC